MLEATGFAALSGPLVAAYFHQALVVLLFIGAVVSAARGFSSDLVEARRRFRLWFIGCASFLGIAIEAGELALRGSAVPGWLELLKVAAIALLALVLLTWSLEVRPLWFAAPAGKPIAEDLPLAERPVIAALQEAMEEKKAYREERLTIGGLATRMKVPEHLLRKVINQRLGYRNFNAFLNYYRIGEVKAALVDPAKARWWGWTNSVTHHDLHHEAGRWNYALYFTWWDRLMGTEHPEYRARLRAAGKAATAMLFAIGVGVANDVHAAEPVHGEWATQGFSAKVRIEACEGGGFCGRITWLWTPNDARGRPLRDEANPDAGSRSRPLVGSQILGGFRKGDAGEWVEGWIYNPEDGRTYSATLRIGQAGELLLRGCALTVFCRTQVWRRVGEVCR